MNARLVTLERASTASSYRIYTEKLRDALAAAGEGPVPIEALRTGAEARHGGVLRPTLTHFLGAFPADGAVRHATEPNAALRRVSVVTLHDLYPFEGTGLMFRVFRSVIRSAARRARRIVTLCGAIRTDVGRFLGAEALARTVVIPPPFPEPGTVRRPTRYDVLWVGSLDPRKRPDRFFEGLAGITDRRLRVGFLCHGRPDPSDTGFARALGEVRARHDLDWIDRNVTSEELDGIYRSSATLVSTSTLEGYHYPVMEAWSRGTPVVLPEIPLYREIYGTVPGVRYYAPGGPFEAAVRGAGSGGPHVPDPTLLESVSYAEVGRRLADLYRGIR